MSKVPVWFDCDTGVDDAVAILLANYLEGIDILGISTLSGNVTIDKTTVNTGITGGEIRDDGYIRF